jgi:hypothetical protein
VKTTSDLFMPVSGGVIEVNVALKDNAPLVNSASFTDGWMIKIKLTDSTEIETLLDHKSYANLVAQLSIVFYLLYANSLKALKTTTNVEPSCPTTAGPILA